MLVNLVPEFLAILAAPDPLAAYHEYLERHKPVLQGYWHNYVLDPASPHAEQVVAAALRAERADLERLLEDVDVAAIAEDALQRSLDRFEADCAVDLYLMVGVGAANAGELVVGGRGIAFVCLEHLPVGPILRRTAWGSRRTCCRCGSPTRWRTRCVTPRRRAGPT